MGCAASTSNISPPPVSPTTQTTSPPSSDQNGSSSTVPTPGEPQAHSTIGDGRPTVTAEPTSTPTTAAVANNATPSGSMGPSAAQPALASSAESNRPSTLQATTSSALPPAITTAELVSGGLLLLSKLAAAAPFPGAEAVASALEKIYVIFNAASSRSEWLSEFMLYLRAIELDLIGAQAAFKRQSYCQQLASRLEQTRTVVDRLSSRGQFVAWLSADSDKQLLATERADLEAIKSAALASMLTEIKQDTAATCAAADDLKRALAESEARHKAQQRDREERQTKERLLARLQPIRFNAKVDQEANKYMAGTRLGMIRAVGEWIKLGTSPNNKKATAATIASSSSSSSTTTSSSSPLFWIQGGPGTGKSCLSAVLCNTYATDIIGVHFCQHDLQVTRSSERMIRSLAHQMSARLPEYEREMKAILPTIFGEEGDSATVGQKPSAEELWQRLIIEPLHAARDSLATERKAVGRKCVLLIDALDEASSISSGAAHGASEILDLLAKSVSKLPPWMGVLVTSRPEAAIVEKLKKYNPSEIICESPENQADVRIFLVHHLTRVVASDDQQRQSAADLLLQKCGGLILAARLMLQANGVIEDDLPVSWKERDYKAEPLTVDEISRWPTGLDEFYFDTMHRIRMTLEQQATKMRIDLIPALAAGEQLIPPALAQIQRIIACVLTAYKPLNLQCLGEMCDIGSSSSTGSEPAWRVVKRLLAPLRALFPLTPLTVEKQPADVAELDCNESLTTVSVYHKSVSDWFLAPARLADDEHRIYHVDSTESHRMMARACWQRLVDEDHVSKAAVAKSADPPLATRIEAARTIHHGAVARVCGEFNPAMLPPPPVLRIDELLAHIPLSPVLPIRLEQLLHKSTITPCDASLVGCDRGLAHSAHYPSDPYHHLTRLTEGDFRRPDEWTDRTCTICHGAFTNDSRKFMLSCETCAAIAYDQLSRRTEAIDQSVASEASLDEMSADAASRAKLDPCAAQLRRWQDTVLAIAACDACNHESFVAAKEKLRVRITSVHQAIEQFRQPLEQRLANSSAFSYAIRYGLAHALDSATIGLVAAYACHLQYWQMRLTLPHQAESFAREMLRVEAMAQPSKTVGVSAVKHSATAGSSKSPLSGVWLEGLMGNTPDRLLRSSISGFTRFFGQRQGDLLADSASLYQLALLRPSKSFECRQAHQLLDSVCRASELDTTRASVLSTRRGLMTCPSSRKPEVESTLLYHRSTIHRIEECLWSDDDSFYVTRGRKSQEAEQDAVVCFDGATGAPRGFSFESPKLLAVHLFGSQLIVIEKEVAAAEDATQQMAEPATPTMSARARVFTLADEATHSEGDEIAQSALLSIDRHFGYSCLLRSNDSALADASASFRPTCMLVFSSKDDCTGGESDDPHDDRFPFVLQLAALPTEADPTVRLADRQTQPCQIDRTQSCYYQRHDSFATDPSQRYCVAMTHPAEVRLWRCEEAPTTASESTSSPPPYRLTCSTVTLDPPIPATYDIHLRFTNDSSRFLLVAQGYLLPPLILAFAISPNGELSLLARSERPFDHYLKSAGLTPPLPNAEGAHVSLSHCVAAPSSLVAAGDHFLALFMAYSPDFDMMMRIVLVSTQTGEVTRSILERGASEISVRLDGPRLLLMGEKTAEEFEVPSMRLLGTHTGTSDQRQFRYSRDGQRILAHNPETGTIEAWCAYDDVGSTTALLEPASAWTSSSTSTRSRIRVGDGLLFSPCGNFLILIRSSEHDEIEVYDIRSPDGVPQRVPTTSVKPADLSGNSYQDEWCVTRLPLSSSDIGRVAAGGIVSSVLVRIASPYGGERGVVDVLVLPELRRLEWHDVVRALSPKYTWRRPLGVARCGAGMDKAAFDAPPPPPPPPGAPIQKATADDLEARAEFSARQLLFDADANLAPGKSLNGLIDLSTGHRFTSADAAAYDSQCAILDQLVREGLFTAEEINDPWKKLVTKFVGHGSASDLFFIGENRDCDLPVHGLLVFSLATRQLLQRIPFDARRIVNIQQHDDNSNGEALLWVEARLNRDDSELFLFGIHPAGLGKSAFGVGSDGTTFSTAGGNATAPLDASSTYTSRLATVTSASASRDAYSPPALLSLLGHIVLPSVNYHRLVHVGPRALLFFEGSNRDNRLACFDCRTSTLEYEIHLGPDGCFATMHSSNLAHVFHVVDGWLINILHLNPSHSVESLDRAAASLADRLTQASQEITSTSGESDLVRTLLGAPTVAQHQEQLSPRSSRSLALASHSSSSASRLEQLRVGPLHASLRPIGRQYRLSLPPYECTENDSRDLFAHIHLLD